MVSSPQFHVKLNTDASVAVGKEAGGGILWDYYGELIFAFYKEFGDVDVLTDESLSLMHGLLLCQERDCNHLLVEVDS